VVTRENEKDLGNLEALAGRIGVNMFSYKTVGMQPHRESYREYEPTDPEMRRFGYDEANRRRKYSIQCPFPFRQPTVFWDGTLVGCEYDYDLDQPWGNVHEKPFTEIWNSPRALSLRNDIRKGRRRGFCRNVCPYQDRVQDSSYLSCKGLRAFS
jgi:MoaA/NifB/PqqE/SkfB family radical SAM enzyme